MANACATGAMPQLKELYLTENQIGDTGVTALANACATGAMAHLELLYLDNNPVSEQTEQTMQIATANRNGLEVLF